ncbi:MAG: hypothetical protein RL662_1519 [Bacteroidota bacterium]|jgi:thiamine pyrophosphokinase
MKTYTLPTLSEIVDAVILANGEFPSHKIPLSILHSNQYIVCCDGAINDLASTSIHPQAIVGDCDSLSDASRTRYSNIIHQINEQETNDLTKSVKFCIEQGKKRLIIVGATGKREDHSIANISLLSLYIEYADEISIITDYGVFNAIDSYTIFESTPKQQVSLFSIIPSKITSYGLKYPIQQKVFSNWWQATLNESEGDRFSIDTNGKVIVFRAF